MIEFAFALLTCWHVGHVNMGARSTAVQQVAVAVHRLRLACLLLSCCAKVAQSAQEKARSAACR